MTFKPKHDIVVIRRHEKKDRTKAGILLPDSVQKKETWGTVVSVGKGVKNDRGVFVPTTVKPGDVVLFSDLQHNEIKVDGETLLLVKEANIFGVLEDDGTK